MLGNTSGCPVGGIGEDFIDTRLGEPWQIAIFLAVFGVLLWFADRTPPRRQMSDLGLGTAAAVGLAQSLALMPGVSRSGITITAGRFLGLDRDAAARVAFLLLVPITFGAVLWQGLTDVALGDVDGDGFPDLLWGNYDLPGYPLEWRRPQLYLSRTPWSMGSMPAAHLPNNSAYVRNVRAEPAGLNRYRITFSAVDAESDPLQVLGEYQFEGSPAWHLMDLGGDGRSRRPLHGHVRGADELRVPVAVEGGDKPGVGQRPRRHHRVHGVRIVARHGGETEIALAEMMDLGRPKGQRPGSSGMS